MGLNIYFQDERGEDVEVESRLQVTHNLNKVLIELGRRYIGYEVMQSCEEVIQIKLASVICEAETC